LPARSKALQHGITPALDYGWFQCAGQHYGGAINSGGTSGNQINSVGPRNLARLY